MFGFFKKKEAYQEKSTEIPKTEKVTVQVKYEYAWKDNIPESERDTPENPSREFCKMLMDLKRVYTRSEIEVMSQELGYSVFDRCGGEGCRHQWKRVTIVKKQE